MDHWTAGMDYWNGLLDYWNGLLEHACHKFEVSMTIVHMHTCMHITAKKERLFQQWISCWSCIIIILCCTVFVREQCSADCDTLHGYHSMDIAHDHMPKRYDDNLLISYNHDSLLH